MTTPAKKKDDAASRIVEVLVPPALTKPEKDNDEDEGDEDAPRSRGPRVTLLPQWGSGTKAVPDHLAVFRVDPAHGFLGVASLDSDEAVLAKRFGGRTLRVELRAADGSKIPGNNNSRFVTIDADPIAPPSAAARTQHAVPATEAAQWDRAELARQSAEERVALLKAEIDSRAERENARTRAELERMKLEHQHALERERERAEQERERAKAEIERERERAKAEREREREQHAASLAMINAHNTATHQMMQAAHQQTMEMLIRVTDKPAADPLAALRVGVDLATSLGAGAGDEATRSFDKLVDTAKEGFIALRNGPRLPPTRAAKQIAAQGSTGAGDASGPAPTGDKKARLKAKLSSAIKNLEANGHDLEELLDSLNGQMGAVAGAPRAAAKTEAPAEPDVTMDDFTD